jgi:hypothetical protein
MSQSEEKDGPILLERTSLPESSSGGCCAFHIELSGPRFDFEGCWIQPAVPKVS